MLEPPKLNTTARQVYDVRELQPLYETACKLGVQDHPIIKMTFSKCYEKAGMRGFSEDCATLSQLLTTIQKHMINDFFIGGCLSDDRDIPVHFKQRSQGSVIFPGHRTGNPWMSPYYRYNQQNMVMFNSGPNLQKKFM